MEGTYKAAKGLIRIKIKTELGCLSEVKISGDFFMYPEDELWKLENTLKGTDISRDKILAKIQKFYRDKKILSPGVTPEDFTEAIIKAVSGNHLL